MGGGQMFRPEQSRTAGTQAAPVPASEEDASSTRRGEPFRTRAGEHQEKVARSESEPRGEPLRRRAGDRQEKLIASDEEGPLSVPQGPSVVEQALKAADRLNEGQPKSEELPEAELQEVAAELKASDAFKDLGSVAEEARAALEEDERKEREGDDAAWRGRLIGPAEQLRDGLVDHLLTNEKLWEQLRASEIAAPVFDPQSRLVIRQALDLNVEGLLGAMGVEQPQERALDMFDNTQEDAQ
jgi:hypothetical protein